MKVQDIDRAMIDSEGKEYEDGTTVKKMLAMASHANMSPQSGISENAEEKYAIGMVGIKIQRARRHVYLDEREMKLLKARVGAIFTPAAVVRLYDVLDGKAQAEKRLRVGEDIDDVGDDQAEERK